MKTLVLIDWNKEGLSEPNLDFLLEKISKTLAHHFSDEDTEQFVEALNSGKAVMLPALANDQAEDLVKNLRILKLKCAVHDTEELNLIKQVQEGNKTLSDKLLTPYKTLIESSIRKTSSSISKDDIPDIYSETCKRILNSLHKFDPTKGGFKNTAMQYAKWTLKTFLQKITREKTKLQHIKEFTPTSYVQQYEIIKETIFKEPLLDIIFGNDFPPHKLISFGFTFFLQWKPQEIVSELSGTYLDKLACRLEKELLEISPDKEKAIKRRFQSLNKKMQEVFNEQNKHYKTVKAYTYLADKTINQTTLKDYSTASINNVTKPLAQQISEWNYRIGLKIIATAMDETSLTSEDLTIIREYLSKGKKLGSYDKI